MGQLARWVVMGAQLGGGGAGGFATDWVVAGLFLIKKSKSKSLSLAWSCVVWPQRGAGMRWVMPKRHPDTQNRPARSRLVVFWVVLATQKPPRPAPAWSTRRAQLRPAPAWFGWFLDRPATTQTTSSGLAWRAQLARPGHVCMWIQTTQTTQRAAGAHTWLTRSWPGAPGRRVYAPPGREYMARVCRREYASMWLSM